MNLSKRQHDLEALKSRTDARVIARTLIGQGKEGPSYDLHRSPFRDDGKNADFAVYANGFHDFGSDMRGDVFDLVQRKLNCPFLEAVQYVERFDGGAVVSKQSINPKPMTGTSEPPSADWQEAAYNVLAEAQDYLWSGKSDAKEALSYLHSQKLNDDTIKSFGLGFNPKPRDFPGGHLFAGIVIPIEADGALYRLSVRTNGNSKYKNAIGSKLGGLFNADAIQSGKIVIIVEGEKDAMVLQQELGDSVVVVTCGGVSSKLSSRWRDTLKKAREVFVSLDNDHPGNTAADELLKTLTGWGIKSRKIVLPEGKGKDVTEFATKHQGDLRAWFNKETQEIWWPNGVPDSIRSATSNYFPPSYVAVLEMLNEANKLGLIDPSYLTMKDIFVASTQLGYKISKNTIRDNILLEGAELIQEMETDLDDLAVSNSRINSDKGSKRGRKEIIYKMVTADVIKQNIITWASPRIYEEAHPVHTNDPTLAYMTPDILMDAISTTEDYTALAREVNQSISFAFHKQPKKKQSAGKRSAQQKRQLIESLNDLTSTPLPVDYPKSTPFEYRVAYTRAILLSRRALYASRRELCLLLGVSNGALKDVLEAAGWQTHEQFASVTLNDASNLPNEIQRKGFETRGFPRFVLIETDTDQEKFGYDPNNLDNIKYHMEQGAMVSIVYQTANLYTLKSEGTFVKKPKLKSSKSTSYGQAGTNKDRIKPFYGPRYNPEWIRAQLQLALVANGWKRQGNKLINSDGGEILDKHTSSHMLLEALLKRPILR